MEFGSYKRHVIYVFNFLGNFHSEKVVILLRGEVAQSRAVDLQARIFTRNNIYCTD